MASISNVLMAASSQFLWTWWWVPEMRGYFNYEMQNNKPLAEILSVVTSSDFCSEPWDSITLSAGRWDGKNGIIHIHRTAFEEEDVFDVKLHRCKERPCRHRICTQSCERISSSYESEKTKSNKQKKWTHRSNSKNNSSSSGPKLFTVEDSPTYRNSVSEKQKPRNRNQGNKHSCVLYVYTNGKKRKLSFQLQPEMEMFLARTMDRIENYVGSADNRFDDDGNRQLDKNSPHEEHLTKKGLEEGIKDWYKKSTKVREKRKTLHKSTRPETPTAVKNKPHADFLIETQTGVHSATHTSIHPETYIVSRPEDSKCSKCFNHVKGEEHLHMDMNDGEYNSSSSLSISGVKPVAQQGAHDTPDVMLGGECIHCNYRANTGQGYATGFPQHQQQIVVGFQEKTKKRSHDNEICSGGHIQTTNTCNESNECIKGTNFSFNPSNKECSDVGTQKEPMIDPGENFLQGLANCDPTILDTLQRICDNYQTMKAYLKQCAGKARETDYSSECHLAPCEDRKLELRPTQSSNNACEEFVESQKQSKNSMQEGPDGSKKSKNNTKGCVERNTIRERLFHKSSKSNRNSWWSSSESFYDDQYSKVHKSSNFAVDKPRESFQEEEIKRKRKASASVTKIIECHSRVCKCSSPCSKSFKGKNPRKLCRENNSENSALDHRIPNQLQRGRESTHVKPKYEYVSNHLVLETVKRKGETKIRNIKENYKSRAQKNNSTMTLRDGSNSGQFSTVTTESSKYKPSCKDMPRPCDYIFEYDPPQEVFKRNYKRDHLNFKRSKKDTELRSNESMRHVEDAQFVEGCNKCTDEINSGKLKKNRGKMSRNVNTIQNFKAPVLNRKYAAPIGSWSSEDSSWENKMEKPRRRECAGDEPAEDSSCGDSEEFRPGQNSESDTLQLVGVVRRDLGQEQRNSKDPAYYSRFPPFEELQGQPMFYGEEDKEEEEEEEEESRPGILFRRPNENPWKFHSSRNQFVGYVECVNDSPFNLDQYFTTENLPEGMFPIDQFDVNKKIKFTMADLPQEITLESKKNDIDHWRPSSDSEINLRVDGNIKKHANFSNNYSKRLSEKNTNELINDNQSKPCIDPQRYYSVFTDNKSKEFRKIMNLKYDRWKHLSFTHSRAKNGQKNPFLACEKFLNKNRVPMSNDYIINENNYVCPSKSSDFFLSKYHNRYSWRNIERSILCHLSRYQLNRNDYHQIKYIQRVFVDKQNSLLRITIENLFNKFNLSINTLMRQKLKKIILEELALINPNKNMVKNQYINVIPLTVSHKGRRDISRSQRQRPSLRTRLGNFETNTRFNKTAASGKEFTTSPFEQPQSFSGLGKGSSMEDCSKKKQTNVLRCGVQRRCFADPFADPYQVFRRC